MTATALIPPANPLRAERLRREREGSICGWTPEAAELLAEYEGLAEFEHDCCIRCASCERLWFAGHGQENIHPSEINRDGDWFCLPCVRVIEAERGGSVCVGVR